VTAVAVAHPANRMFMMSPSWTTYSFPSISRCSRAGRSGFASVAAGYYHTLAVKTDGTLWAWGDDGDGQLGNGTTNDCPSPQLLGVGFATVAAGGIYTAAVKAEWTL